MADEDVKIPTQDELVAIMEREEAASAPAPEVTPAAPVAPAVPAPAGEAPPAPAPSQEAAKPLALSDTDIVVDPTDGQPKPWGSIKGERLRQADYTRKTMELAEMRRNLETESNKLRQEAEAAKLRAEMGLLPALPEDDPYAKRILAQQKQVEQMAAAMQSLQDQVLRQQQEREIASARVQLEATEAQLKTAHGFGDREIALVEQEFLRRRGTGEEVALEVVAAEFKLYLDSVADARLKAWQEKNRVGAPAAAATAPAAGAPAPPIDIRSEGFIEMIKGALSAAR